jgi:hypothetical protein
MVDLCGRSVAITPSLVGMGYSLNIILFGDSSWSIFGMFSSGFVESDFGHTLKIPLQLYMENSILVYACSWMWSSGQHLKLQEVRRS